VEFTIPLEVLGSEYEQVAGPSVTEYVRAGFAPTMLMVPVRKAVVALGSATNVTLLLPALPLEVICSQVVALLTALQLQTPGATTDAAPLPPLEGTVAEAVTSCQVHKVPACVIDTLFPAILNGGLVVRGVVDAAFDVNVRLTEPLPVPEEGETVTHGTWLDAVHEQLLPLAFTGTANGPPPPAMSGPLTPEASTVTLQAKASCKMLSIAPPMSIARFCAAVVELGATE